jgi:hypothetical protein
MLILVFQAITGKFKDVFETSNTDSNVSSYKFKPNLPNKKSRYYSQEIVFGEDFQHRLGKAKYFVVRFLYFLLIIST